MRKVEEDHEEFLEKREMKKGVMLDIKQRHPHPLGFSDVEWKSERCNVCRFQVSGANYKCNDCKFFLHELCSQLPADMDYIIDDSDDYETLFLVEPPSPHYLNRMFICAICNTPGDGFSYHCVEYWRPFVCHVSCALNTPHSLMHQCHKHPLTLQHDHEFFLYPLCCACGTEVNDTVYSCDRCKIIVHVECALLPTTISHKSHLHPLNLTTNILEPLCCDVCGVEKEWKGWIYTCGDCKFNAHLDCICQGDPSPYMELGAMLEHHNHEHPLTLARRSGDMSQCSHCDKQIKRNLVYLCLKCNYKIDLECVSRLLYAKPIGWVQEEDEVAKTGEKVVEAHEMALEVEHFSHPHPLVLLDVQSIGERCNGCRLVISGGPSYGCIYCNFFLHKSCLELSHKIVYPHHRRHLLYLSKDHPPPFNNGIFYCYLCEIPGDGFSYSCTECDKYVLHVHCALRTPMEIRVASHEHLLTLNWHTGDVKCDACKGYCNEVAFSCRKCSFNLHVNCSFLPPERKCRSHRHTLSLVHHYIEEESYVYYCDACEEKRPPEAWVYCCKHEECDFVAHTSCEPFPFLKLGETRKIESHDHPITLTVRRMDINRFKDHGILSGLQYECKECSYKLDFFREKI